MAAKKPEGVGENPAAKKPERAGERTAGKKPESPEERAAGRKPEGAGENPAAKKAEGAGEKPVAEIRDGKVYILQPGTKVYIKTADLCAMTGKSNQWIGQLASQGVLFKVQTNRGNLYEMHDAVSAYLRNLEDKQASVDEKEESLRKKQLAAEVSQKQSKAIILGLDVKERQGKMHRSEDVAAMTEDLIFAIRGALLSLPGRLAVDVLSARNAAEASDMIRNEVFQIMEELARYEYDPAKYQERVRERMKLEATVDDE